MKKLIPFLLVVQFLSFSFVKQAHALTVGLLLAQPVLIIGGFVTAGAGVITVVWDEKANHQNHNHNNPGPASGAQFAGFLAIVIGLALEEDGKGVAKAMTATSIEQELEWQEKEGVFYTAEEKKAIVSDLHRLDKEFSDPKTAKRIDLNGLDGSGAVKKVSADLKISSAAAEFILASRGMQSVR